MKWSKYVLLTAFIFCFAGFALFNIGKAKGGLSYYKNHSKTLSSKNNLVKKKTKIEAVSRLQIDMEHLDLLIRKSGDQNFYLEYKVQKVKKKNPLTVHIDDGKLTAYETDGKTATYFRQIRIGTGITALEGGRKTEYNNRLTLYFPKDAKLEECQITLGEGDADCKILNAGQLDCALEEGDFYTNKLTVESGSVFSKEGDLDCGRIFFSKNLSLTSTEGDISCSLASGNTTNTAITADTKEGDMDFPGKYNMAKDKTHEKGWRRYSVNSHIQEPRLSLSTEEGDIEIN